jgi:protoporphyrin/coproporphyrin ferrochelatase
VLTTAYEFRRPGLAEALDELKQRGCSRAVVVPMYVADGDFTHGVTRLAIGDALRRTGWAPERVSLCSITDAEHHEDRLADALVSHCLGELSRRGLGSAAPDHALLLAAHGTVVTPRPGVDNGLAHFARVLIRVKRRLGPSFGLVRVGWLNHTRGGKWTTPDVPAALEIIRRRGFDRLVYFPWGFTTDNAETALEGRVALEGMAEPFSRVEYLPCLNAHGPLIELLADRIAEHLGETVVRAA